MCMQSSKNTSLKNDSKSLKDYKMYHECGAIDYISFHSDKEAEDYITQFNGNNRYYKGDNYTLAPIYKYEQRT